MKSSIKASRSLEDKLGRFPKTLPVHSRIVLQYRDLILKSLSPELFSGNSSLLSRIPGLFKSSDGQESDRRTERMSAFVDGLMRGDRRSFDQFMDFLREHNRVVHATLERATRSLDVEMEEEAEEEEGDHHHHHDEDDGEEAEDDYLLEEVHCGEGATMTGRAIGDLLRRQKYRVNARLYDDLVPRGLLDSDARGQVVCQVVECRGAHRDKPWMKHDKRRKVKEPGEGKDPQPFMAVLNRDVVFRVVKVIDIPDLVRKPLRCGQAYVADEKGTRSFSAVNVSHCRNPVGSEAFHSASTLRLSYRNSATATATAATSTTSDELMKMKIVQTPPPLPPKPESLSPLPLSKLKLQDRYSDEATLKLEEEVAWRFNSTSGSARNNHSTLSPSPPPIPVRQKVESNAKPLPPPAAPAFGLRAVPPSFRDAEPLNMVQISSYPKAFSVQRDNNNDDGGVEDDNISLSYFIEPEDSIEGPYEAIEQQDQQQQQLDAEGGDDNNETLVVDDEFLVSGAGVRKDQRNEPPPCEHVYETNEQPEVEQPQQQQDQQQQQRIDDYEEASADNDAGNLTSDCPSDHQDCSDVSVSRSSSGVSATVKARDSGIDSVVSHSLHDSPFFGPAEDLDTLIPEAAESHCPEHGARAAGIEPSYYEDIDLMNDHSGHYLDPRSDEADAPIGGSYLSSEQKILPAGSLLMCDNLPACKFEGSSYNEYVDEALKSRLASFKGTRICYDREGVAYYVNAGRLRKHGDPMGEPWFYPIPLSNKEATLFLRQERQKGCFLVYQSAEPDPSDTENRCSYYLSLSGEFGEIVHYPIVENFGGDVMIEGHDRSFLTLADLVQYFRRNRGSLAARLRRPLKESRLPITAGQHYPANYELLRKSIRLYGKIVSEGRFGLTCLGSYGQQQVFVKALQNDSSVEEDDDFLNEALVLMNVGHESVIRLVGVCFRSRPFFIVTENFGTGTLRDSLVNGLLADKCDVLCDLCVQMVAAMVHLERRRFILHRNLTAGNFFLSSNFVVKLFNFERARLVDDDSYSACGSEEILVRWSAPEVLRDSRYSTKSDVWSLAVVFWEAFSHGQVPYSSMTEQEVALHVADRGRPTKPADCENFMFSIMQQCWRHRPSSRPSFAALEGKVRAQCNVHFGNVQRKFSDAVAVSSPLHSSASLSDDLHVTLKSSKRSSQSGMTTPLLSTPTLNFRTSNPYSEGDLKIDEAPKGMAFGNSKTGRLLSRSTMERSSMLIDTCSASIPFNQFGSGDSSRGNKMRKSLRNLLKVTKNKNPAQ